MIPEILSLNKKIVIVGHGLAGAVIAQTLIEEGQEVVVIDAQLPHSASQVSAGLINPFIGPKFNTPADFSLCMKENQTFLNKMEKKCKRKILESIDLYRVFQSSKQKERWECLSELFKKDHLSKSGCLQLGIDSEYGAGKTTAWKFHSSEFIKYSRQVLQSSGNYFVESFDPTKWTGHKVVFCEGYRAIYNVWFKYLPFAPAQGEVITIESPYNLNVSNGIWHLTDNKSQTARIGSTWKHQGVESGPTLSAKKKIFRQINFLPKLKTEAILDHQSGVRSGTQDRNPIMGIHPKIENYYIFNGFGSRGCTTIVRCAKELANLIIHRINLPAHKDLKRFH